MTSIKAVPQKASLDPEKTFAEFFAGIGLMRMGLELDGWQISYSNDIDADKHNMYRTQFPDADEHFTLGDIHEMDAEAVPEVALATASFPCTDLSLAGERKGLAGKQSSAFWGFMRILEEMGSRRPPLVMLENVAGFLTSNGGEDIKQALLALNALGYAVDMMIVDAERFVPQSRVRLFVVGVFKEDSSTAASETRGFYETPLRPKALSDFVFSHPDIHWNLLDLPALPERSQSLEDIVEDLPSTDEMWWNDHRVSYFLNQVSAKHMEQLSFLMGGDRWSYATAFRRVRKGRSMAELRFDGIAGCLRTPKGGSARQILVKAGKGKVQLRLLSARECARLMGADDFKIDTSLNKALFGFGDAVCVPVIEWISRNCLSPLYEEWRASRQINDESACSLRRTA